MMKAMFSAAHVLPVLVLLVAACVVGGSSVHILVLNTATGRFASRGVEYVQAAQLWKQHIADIGGLGPQRASVNITFVDVGDDVNHVANVTRRALAGEWGSVDYFISPYSSTLTPAAALEVELYQPTGPNDRRKLIVSGGAASESVFVCDEQLRAPCTKPHVRRFQQLQGVLTPASYYLRPFISLVKIKQASTVALVAEDDAFPLSACAGALQAASENRMQVVMNRVIPRVTLPLSDSTRIAVDAAVADMQRLQPDVVVGCVYSPGCEAIIEAAYRNDYLPNAMAFTICVGSSSLRAKFGSKLAYIYGPGQWDHRLTGVSFTESAVSLVQMFGQNSTNATASASPQRFADRYMQLYGSLPTYQAAGALAAFYVVEIGIALANSTDPEKVRDNLHLMFESTFFGLLASSRFGSNIYKPMVTWQYDMNADIEVITPLSAAKEDSIYPMPRWDERAYVKDLYRHGQEHAVITIIALLMASSVALMVFLWLNRNRPFIKHASVLFCEISVLGSIIMYAAILTWPIENNGATCALRPWLLGLGFTTIIAPLLAKTYRIYKIFHNTQLRVAPIKDAQLLLAVLGMLAPMFFFLILFASISPLHEHVIIRDRLRPSLNVTVCKSDHMGVFIGLMLTYATVLVLAAAVLAYRTRNVWNVFNDARYTHVAVYNLLFCGVVLGIFLAANIDSHHTEFLLRSFLLIVMIAGTQAVLFIPKIMDSLSAVEIKRPHSFGSRITTRAALEAKAQANKFSSLTYSQQQKYDDDDDRYISSNGFDRDNASGSAVVGSSTASSSSQSTSDRTLLPPARGGHVKRPTPEVVEPVSVQSLEMVARASRASLGGRSMSQHKSRLEALVELLQLRPHMEGGYYASYFRSTESVRTQGGRRNCATIIYYLLPSGSFSQIHRLESEEVWIFMEGDDLVVHDIHPSTGQRRDRLLGRTPGLPRHVRIKPHHWFAAQPLHQARARGLLDRKTKPPPGGGRETSGYSLASCVVAPGFDYGDFEMAEYDDIVRVFPQHSNLLRHLIRGASTRASDPPEPMPNYSPPPAPVPDYAPPPTPPSSTPPPPPPPPGVNDMGRPRRVSDLYGDPTGDML